MQTTKLFGVEIPRYQDCNQCGTKDACRFTTYAYDQPCSACKEKQPPESPHKWQNGNPLKNREIAGVWEGAGRVYYTNHKGDVIRDEPKRPLPVGKKNWR